MRQRNLSLLLLGALLGCDAAADPSGAPSKGAVPPADPHGLPPMSLDDLLRRDGEGLQVEPLPGGGERISLGGTFQHAQVARIGADGSIERACVHDVEDAEAFFSGQTVDAEGGAR